MNEAQMQARIEALEKEVADLKARLRYRRLKASLSEMISDIIKAEIATFAFRGQVMQRYSQSPPRFR